MTLIENPFDARPGDAGTALGRPAGTGTHAAPGGRAGARDRRGPAPLAHASDPVAPTPSAADRASGPEPLGLLSRHGREATSSVIRDLLDWTRRPGMLSLAGGIPAAELLPVERVGEAVDRVLATHGPAALQYGPTDGEAVLRSLVAPTPERADDVVVTTGSQQSLDLLARVLLDPGDTVVVEGPSYLGALSTFRAVGAHLVEVPGDAAGMDTEVLAGALDAGLRPKAVYVVPEFANPTGATLSAARRRHLVELAERHGFVIVEDDPYGALRFDGPSVAPIADRTDLAVRLGTASKTLAPGLRVGWATLPAWLRGPVVRAKQAVDLHTSTLDQLVVADVLADEDFVAGHLARLRSVYGRRCRALVGALARVGGGRFEVAPPAGGMFAWAALHPSLRLTADAVLPSALVGGVAFVPGSAFGQAPGEGERLGPAGDGERRLRLCFATLDEARLADAVERLVAAVDAVR